MYLLVRPCECGPSSAGPELLSCLLVMPHPTCRVQVLPDSCAQQLKQEFQQLCLANLSGCEQLERAVLCNMWVCFTRSAHLRQSFVIGAVSQVTLFKTSATETFQPRMQKWKLTQAWLRSRKGNMHWTMVQHLYSCQDSKHSQLHFISYQVRKV